jgi:hypothetical protein
MEQLMKLAIDNGLVLEQQATVTFDGSGPVAQMMAQAGGIGMTVTSKVTEISTAPIADELFVVPADYVKK